jgi:hypothetical protein
MDSANTPKGRDQPFARGQGRGFGTGPFLGGYLYALVVNVAAAGTLTIPHTLRVVPRHVEIVGTILSEYPSRVCFSTASPSSVTIVFESAQSAGATAWLW